MADIDFTITQDTVKAEMLKVWEMVHKGLRGGTVLLTLGREKNSTAQIKCQHAMIGDIKTQANRSGGSTTFDQWKDLLVSEFAREKQLMGEPLKQGNSFSPSLCGTYMVSHRPSTKTFNKLIGSEYIEYLHVKGAEYGVEFTDKTLAEYENCRQANG
tara:strand:+ start:132 stop:602 length:471 start_codon:yes stop_codon:yes gene_type:complete